jgi:hypothetical protein
MAPGLVTVYAPGGPSSGQKGSILFLEYFFIFGGAAKLRWAGGAQRPVWRVYEPKKSGERSARARTRGQNPLVIHIYRNDAGTVQCPLSSRVQLF